MEARCAPPSYLIRLLGCVTRNHRDLAALSGDATCFNRRGVCFVIGTTRAEKRGHIWPKSVPLSTAPLSEAFLLKIKQQRQLRICWEEKSCGLFAFWQGVVSH